MSILRTVCAALAIMWATTGCTEVVPRVTPEFMARVQAVAPTADERHISAGRVIYVNHCGSCHAMPAPTSVPIDRWPQVMDVMARKSHLRPGERQDIDRYIAAVNEAAR